MDVAQQTLLQSKLSALKLLSQALKNIREHPPVALTQLEGRQLALLCHDRTLTSYYCFPGT